MGWFDAIILAIIEGITEFLPISSTGHMILGEEILNIEKNAFENLFLVSIQFGAILSVVILYWKKFLQSFNFYVKLFIAFIPAAIFGFFLNDFIDKLLDNVLVVAISLFVGGIILIFVDKWFIINETDIEEENQSISYKKALIIGIFQIISMIPGVSRSAATIIGGLTQKLNRKNAAEFSFFLAVPTMLAASLYKTYKFIDTEGISLIVDKLPLLIIGNIVAFFVALLAIKTFINFLTKFGFKIFGYYRIILGAVIIILLVIG
jgi:undecaprenyl-diphosphatase